VAVKLSRRLCIAVALCATATALTACGDGSSGRLAPGSGYSAQRAPFIVGVWLQPSYSFAKWRARGINTVVGFDSLGGMVSYRDWRAELEHQGLYAIRQPQGAPSQDARDPRLLAWMQVDGPDSGENPTSPAVLQRRYERWKAAARRVPVFLNFCGACVLARNHAEGRYSEWIAASDWVSNDFYPVNSNHPDWIDRFRDPKPPIGVVLDRLRSWSRGKRQIEIVEASDQGGGSSRRAPTADELRGMVWHSIIHGASGIIYFPQRVDREFKFDAVPPNLVAEMKRINRSISRLAPVLLSSGQRMHAPRPFERATRVQGRRVYTIVLNLSHRVAYYQRRRYLPFQVRVTAAER
jgi:hypothetical protein